MTRTLFLLVAAMWAGLARADALEYGPDDAIGRLIAHADSLKPEWHITRPQTALSCLLEHGTERTIGLLEATIADPATPDGYKQWLLERIPMFGCGGTGAVPCAEARILTNLLEPDRLRPEAWAVCFASLASVLGGSPACIEEQHLGLVKERLADESFLGLRSALRIFGAAAGGGSSATMRREGVDLFWQGYERLIAMEGELAPDANGLSAVLSGGLHRFLETYPAAVDQRFVDQAASALARCGKAGADCERAADLLLSTLRARPDLRASPNWEELRGALLNGYSPRELPEGTLIAIANLLPSAPQWIDAAAVDAFLAALVEKEGSLRKRNSRSYFGGATECLSACAIYGTEPRLRERIVAALWRIAGDGDAAATAQREAMGALAAIAWNKPEVIDANFKRATLTRAARGKPEGFDYGPDSGALALLQLSIETHPELTTRGDLEALRKCSGSSRAAFNPGIVGTVLALAATCSDELYAELEAMLVGAIVTTGGAADSGQQGAAYSEQRLLTRARCVRAGLDPCE